jgi:hypothetical protein
MKFKNLQNFGTITVELQPFGHIPLFAAKLELSVLAKN